MNLEQNLLLLLLSFFLDMLFGDPVYRFHPVRLIGNSLVFIENALWKIGLNGRGGGILLFLLLSILWLSLYYSIYLLLLKLFPLAAYAFQVYLGWHLLSLKDLHVHAGRVGKAISDGDLASARQAVSMLVGRDTTVMDLPATGRATVESLSENLVDGGISPMFYFLLFGIPGALLYKVVSTMDSMVGYKNERYLYFGWCGARLDDLLNWLPARGTWLLISLAASLLPGMNGRAAFRVGLEQHALMPVPNSGWSEAGAAGALGIRLVGPIHRAGVKVTEIWLGERLSPEGGRVDDIPRAIVLNLTVTLLFWVLAFAAYGLWRVV
ncbi:MAG: cobalamin biosynthesis protein CobD [Planctomycetes bacterium]|nr:cobalamin biosynthesis protein CobD [Planctomycetota bacterium]